ncbi:MAG TPA: hypothetical protein PKD55_16705 [Bellilinea sp.]|nr:hypothetical protein [Bellilinea sp.]
MRTISAQTILGTILQLRDDEELTLPDDLLEKIVKLEAQSVEDQVTARTVVLQRLERLVDDYFDEINGDR